MGTDSGTDVLLFPMVSGLDHATDQYVAYCQATVGPYPHILHPGPFGIFKYTSSFTTKGANRHGQDTLPLHGENLSLP